MRLISAPRRRPALAGLLLIAMASACAGPGVPIGTTPSVRPAAGSPTPSPSAAAASLSGDIEGSFDVGGRTLWVSCRGSGSPTIVFEAGLGSGANAFQAARMDLAATTRACIYDRASLGRSQPLPQPNATAGASADELSRLLDSAGIDGPSVLVGHSYGGMIARLAAHRHPDSVIGLVLVDASSGHQFEGSKADPSRPWLVDPSAPWRDGDTVVDREGSVVELRAIQTLGRIPVAVITQGQMNGAFEMDWSRFQDELATLSTNRLHVVARDAGHSIQDDAPELLSAIVREVVTAARDGSLLPVCGAELERLGATCLASTMTARLAGWQKIRDAVQPAAGPFPGGTYRSELTGAESASVTGQPADFQLRVFTWTLARGHWTVSIVTDGVSPETLGDVYAATGQELTIRLPEDWRIPGTPGVNRLRWTRDADGTIRLEQVDDARRDDSFISPWTRIGDASGG